MSTADSAAAATTAAGLSFDPTKDGDCDPLPTDVYAPPKVHACALDAAGTGGASLVAGMEPTTRSALPVTSMQEYYEMWQRSISSPEIFFASYGRDLISWYRPFTHVMANFKGMRGETAWFDDGELNACYNCVDRHAAANPDGIAIIFEPELSQPAPDTDTSVKITYSDLLFHVCQLSNALRALGVSRGDVVAIYLPMIPQAIIAMLACARIGAPHSVVFSGFSSAALRDRICDAKCKVLITADAYSRAGKHHDLITRARAACSGNTPVKNVIVVRNPYVYTTPNVDDAVAAAASVATPQAQSPEHISLHGNPACNLNDSQHGATLKSSSSFSGLTAPLLAATLGNAAANSGQAGFVAGGIGNINEDHHNHYHQHLHFSHLKRHSSSTAASSKGLLQSGNNYYQHAIDAPEEHDCDMLCSRMRGFSPCETMSAESPLFVLYTSGSTGRPKGLVHSTAGYLLGAMMSSMFSFDMANARKNTQSSAADGGHKSDVFANTADVGWITGHTYGLYGPLALGATMLIFGAPPTYSGTTDVWRLLARHRAMAFYTAPTVLRVLRGRLNESALIENSINEIFKHMRVFGSVGEPIDPDTWRWLHNDVGQRRIPVVDTYWQTETGAHVCAPLPFATPTKPSSATFPVFGVNTCIVDPLTGTVLANQQDFFANPKECKSAAGASKPAISGVLCIRGPWPSVARTILNDHKRYRETYFPLESQPDLFWTGDAVVVDSQGYLFIRGRVDDVINVAGHRLSTAEIESALSVLRDTIEESAVVGSADHATGQKVIVFITLRHNAVFREREQLCRLVTLRIRDAIGAIAAPRKLVVARALPKTRSGKIMRRVLRKIADGEADSLGDMSTIEDPNVVNELIQAFKEA